LFILAPRIRKAETVRRAVCFSQIGLLYSQIAPASERINSLRKNVCGLHIKAKGKNVIERFSVSLHFLHGNVCGFSLILASATIPTNSSVTQERKPAMMG